MDRKEILQFYETYMYGKWRDGSDDEVSYQISGSTMRKAILVLLALVLLLSAVGCGKPKTSYVTGTKAIESCKTVGEAAALKGAEEEQHGYLNNEYYYVFTLDNTYYRVTAAMPEEAYDALWDLDYFDEEYDAKYSAIVAPFQITKYENLSERIPTQEKLDELSLTY